ncbi:MAG TPA: RNase adapter RapZ [Candidatus Acidoferrales bacterium]|nr:RNase adapter RapZ [Candidatus Acidoferrales bacterium]
MAQHQNRNRRHLVVLTGLSGSGKSTVLKTFEDLGFYCIDNLPIGLIPMFADLPLGGEGDVTRAAVLVDAREGEQIAQLPKIVRLMRRDGVRAELVFIEASEEALLRRFSETRRPHPLAQGTSVRAGLARERKLMEPIRKVADVVIDTTKFNVHELRAFITRRFQERRDRPLLVSLVSFGYRYGIPSDADLVFDVRFLPNPQFVTRLRKYSGKDKRVARYIRSFPQTGEFLKRIEGLLTYLIPHYIREGKSYLTIAFGCTGGRHRSVMMAEAQQKLLAKDGYATKVVHRDIDK